MDSSNAHPVEEPSSSLHLEALGCLERGGTVVTANARAARSLRWMHGEAQRQSGKLAWPTPPIHDWEGWLGILWNRHLHAGSGAPLLLSAWQERAVWKRIAGPRSHNSEAIAQLAAEGWKLLGDFCVHDQRWWPWRGSSSATTDAEAFREWAQAFDRECVKKRWLSRGDLPALLAESLRRGVLDVPGEILLVGFDRLTPSQQALIQSLRASGVPVVSAQLPRAAGRPQMVEAKDMRDELVTCAWWIRFIVAANPAAKIAVIVQDIENTRGEIGRIFRRILAPRSAGIDADGQVPFEFSLGVPLATVPVIQAALLLLRWAVAPLDQSAISWMMMSGFLAASNEELGKMAALDAEIRKHGNLPSEMPIEAFAAYRPRNGSQQVQRWLSRLGDFHKKASATFGASRRRNFSQWVDLTEELLHDAQWPGARTLQTQEFQALSRWERLLGDLAGLAFDGSRVGYREFVTTIDRYANETIFAPESQQVPVQIMGTFESSGQEFDAVWFLGADDGQWPPPAQPHPLLPGSLQRKAGMPHAGIEADWQLALSTTLRIAGSAAQCVFSYAQRDGSGELRPSGLLTGAFGQPMVAISSERFRAALTVPEYLLHRLQTGRIEDDSTIAWPHHLEAGGAATLKHQAACPFRSFAMRRLGAEDLNAAERGLNARDRGNILHSVLQSLWSQDGDGAAHLHTRADLLNATAAGTLPAILAEHIQRVFKQRSGDYQEHGWRSGYLAAERDRLQRLLLQWLQVEGKRTEFAVEAQEKEFSAEVNGLKLRLRVDRIDQVEGGRFVLDYKAGKVTPALWDGDRPDDPQLPLYGTQGAIEDLRGVLFAQIRPGEMKFSGRVEAATETLMKDLSQSSDLVKKPLDGEMLQQWSAALTGLADRFSAGDAEVAPKAYPKTCKYCKLSSLCRVAETAIALEVEDEVESSESGEEYLSLEDADG